MTKSEYNIRIENLFNAWKKEGYKHELYEKEGNCFSHDGIINFEKWEKSEPRIIFLVKENHDDSYDPWDGITLKKDGVLYSNKFSMNIARWRYLLQMQFINSQEKVTYERVDFPDILDDIATVEVKKLNEGKKRSLDIEIEEYAKQDKRFLREEIDLINPQIVLCGFTINCYKTIYSGEVNERISPEIETCKCFKHENRLIIDFYHPSRHPAFRLSDEDLFNVLYTIMKEGNVFERFDWGRK